MFNFKSVLALAMMSSLSLSAAQANEMAQVDISDLYATINAQLADNLNQMQQEVVKDVNEVLITENDQQIKTVRTQVAD
ncbi:MULTISPECIES: hypothetical protein [Pseudomonadati]|uniref:Uncharacterized protein n=1 Tax=Shewanella aestuarii TaxID=1028752 RepID=A0ABT0L2W4_9GAMM|nr:hypothetical protein [Shewanella aestuarii]MCL1117815.1 hypothetical protein [Shewanella aestuarii]GGN77193.1 hypothetical protein GCM10009193_19110 [Shewanella aestuarii]